MKDFVFHGYLASVTVNGVEMLTKQPKPVPTLLDRFRREIILATRQQFGSDFWRPFAEEWIEDWKRRKLCYVLFPRELRLNGP